MIVENPTWKDMVSHQVSRCKTYEALRRLGLPQEILDEFTAFHDNRDGQIPSLSPDCPNPRFSTHLVGAWLREKGLDLDEFAAGYRVKTMNRKRKATAAPVEEKAGEDNDTLQAIKVVLGLNMTVEAQVRHIRDLLA